MPFPLLLAAALAAAAPLGPAAAIALAEAHPRRETTGLYRMTVAASARTAKAVFLNSTGDYRRPDNLTFALSLVVARELEKRWGMRPEAYLTGKAVTVKGGVRLDAIVNTFSGRPHSFNRLQHVVRIDHPDQIVAVE